MASAYSDDLRRKFVEAYQRGDGSLEELAGRFGVSLGWAEKVMRTLRQSGRIERPQGGKRGPASKLTEERRQQLRRWIEVRPDLTLIELQIKLLEQYRLEVSLSRLWTVLREMELTLKKSPSMPPSRTPKRSAARASTGWRRRAGSIRRS